MSASGDAADLGPLDIGQYSGRAVNSYVGDNGHDDDQRFEETPVTPTQRSSEIINGVNRELHINHEAAQKGFQDGEETPLVSPSGERPTSAGASISTPDDTPSLQGSTFSSPRKRPQLSSPSASLRPFDRRFQARPSLSPRVSSRQSSTSHLGHKPRQASLLSQLTPSEADTDHSEPPWEVVRWTRLRKITGEAFSESGRRSFGRPTCIAASSVIVLGTTKGVILVFDYHQNLQAIIGLGTKATEAGGITAIALSADHSTVAAGHASGDIFTWEIAKPGKPFLHIPATSLSAVQDSRQDGHVDGVSILHIGFLGTRRTALVSADDRGMAFSHLATRGMGAIARTIHTSRILGRYPELSPHNSSKPRKPSSVLAFSPLPLGNVESATDSIGLVAMLTPYLLVIVSTTPIAQTQHKAARPKELAAHGALSAALAWYPSMKQQGSQNTTNAKLAYCWLNVLTILEVLEVEPSDNSEKERPPEFNFKFRKRWQANESIVAVQWLSRSVLAVITITQQLLIMEDSALEVTDSVDLLGRHVYHTDFFSDHLSPLIEKLDEENAQMHGVVADAFFMSFRAYKGRLFLLGFNDIALGTRSNWADRLIALMEQGDFVSSIRLASSFYGGGGNRATVGLPEDTEARHALVREKLIEMMSASLRYAFGKNEDAGNLKVSDEQIEELAKACFVACLETGDMEFLFEEVFTWYHESKATRTFLQILETNILEDHVTVIPPIVLKELVNDFVQRGQNVRLEEIVCRLSPLTMDLDQITFLCKQNKLYDALLYVWSQGLSDYTTMLKQLNDIAFEDESAASKIFPYMSYTLTGRVYPTGEQMKEDIADQAKLDIYFMLFSGSSGQESGSPSRFDDLRKLLRLDTASFMSMLNEAFEDGFLNGSSESENNVHGPVNTEEQRFKSSLNRQYILRILLQVLIEPEHDQDDIIYLDMFIARNLPKYQQFLLLPGNVLHRVLIELCKYSNSELREDRQLSAEYLLSVYQPPDLLSLIPLFNEARFYRIVKAIYSAEKQYALLLETCFKDVDHPEMIFSCARDCLRRQSTLTKEQRRAVQDVIVQNASVFLAAGLTDAADTIDSYVPELHSSMLTTLTDDEHSQYQYLREMFEPSHDRKRTVTGRQTFVEQYVRLLCDYDPHHIKKFIEGLAVGDLRLEEVLSALESSSAIDAAVFLMAREGKVRAGLDRLLSHLHTLESALTGLIEGADNSPDLENSREATNDLMESITKYIRIGIWLCQNQSKMTPYSTEVMSRQQNKRHNRLPSEYTQDDLSPSELLWLDLIDAVVQVMRNLSEEIETTTKNRPGTDSPPSTHPYAALLPRLRLAVQAAFSALLASTSSPQTRGSNADTTSQLSHKPTFLPILSAFLTRAARTSPSLSHLRTVLSSIFAAYAYEEDLLALASRLLAKDLFARVQTVHERRRRGWRPLGMACAGCGRRAWGPSAGRGVWEAWEARSRVLDETHERLGQSEQPEVDAESVSSKGKGKGKVRPFVSALAVPVPPTPSTPGPETAADTLVVFSCRHLFHRRCLEKAGAVTMEGDAGILGSEERWRCPLESSEASTGTEE